MDRVGTWSAPGDLRLSRSNLTEYALRIIDQLTARSIQIATFPFSGRMVPEYELTDVREVIEGPYRVIYLIESEHQKIEVLAVIHSSREQLQPLG